MGAGRRLCALFGDERRSGAIVEGGDQGVRVIRQRIAALLPAGGDGSVDALDVAAPGVGLGAEGVVTLHDAAPLGASGGIVRQVDARNTQEGPVRGSELAQILRTRFRLGIGLVSLLQECRDVCAHRLQGCAARPTNVIVPSWYCRQAAKMAFACARRACPMCCAARSFRPLMARKSRSRCSQHSWRLASSSQL